MDEGGRLEITASFCDGYAENGMRKELVAKDCQLFLSKRYYVYKYITIE